MDPGKFLLLPLPPLNMDPGKFLLLPPPTESIRAKLGLPPQMDVGPYAYACPVWERSTHAKKLNATLNETCRMITGCLKPTNINSLPILAGIAPSDIRRAVASRTERTRQTMDERHPLNGHLGVMPRLKSQKSFIKCTEPINTTAKAVRLELWRE